MRKGFFFYTSFADAIMQITDDQERVKAYDAVVNYAVYDKETQLESGEAGIVYAIAKSLLDAQKENYENGMKGAKYGKKGGRPKKVQDDAPTQEQPKKPAKVEDPKLSYGEYGNVKLTAAEHDKLIEKYGAEETQAAIEFFDQYITEKGYKSKSHYLAMCRWVFDAVTERKTKKTTAINADDCAFDKLFKEAGLMA